MEINSSTKIIDLLTEKPETVKVLQAHGMHCMGCLGAGVETIEDSCKMHSIDIEVLLTELKNI